MYIYDYSSIMCGQLKYHQRRNDIKTYKYLTASVNQNLS